MTGETRRRAARRPAASRWQRLLGWLDQAAGGLLVWWLILGVMALLGFGYFPFDLHDRNQARSLQRHGQWVVATDVQVHVHWVGGRGNNYYEVDGVRVRLDGRATPVDLENVNASSDNPIYDHIKAGWQAPTPVTKYQPPLPVRVQHDGDGAIKVAMAEQDYAYWTDDNTDPEFGLGMGFTAVGLAAVSLVVNKARNDRRDRRRTSGHLPGTRAGRRADARAWAGKNRRGKRRG